jgi:hypothetical protein
MWVVHQRSLPRRTSAGYPRFNMPFELGLCVLTHPKSFFMLESEAYRLQRTLSDLNGHDPLIHSNEPHALLARLQGVFQNERYRPGLDRLKWLLDRVHLAADRLIVEYGSLYTKLAFEDLVLAAEVERDRRPHV